MLPLSGSWRLEQRLTLFPLFNGESLPRQHCLAAALSLSVWCAAGLLMARVLRTEAQWRVVNMALGVLLALSILPMWL